MNPDVVVVGAGAAGLAAAVSLAEAGLACHVVEQNDRPGGTTAHAVGSICVCLPPPDGDDSIEDFLADTARFLPADAAHLVPADLRHLLARTSGETLGWLRALGVPLTGPYPEHPHRRPRLYATAPDGRSFIWWLLRRAHQLGVTITCGARVTRLLRHGARVAGVRAGGVDLRGRVATVLACGDFAANDDLKARYLTPAAATSPAVNPTSRGDGLALGRSVGAAWRNMGTAFAPQLRFVARTGPPADEWSPALFTAGQAAGRVIPGPAGGGADEVRASGWAAMPRAYMAPAAEDAALILDTGELIRVPGAVDRVAATASRTAYLLLDSRWLPGGEYPDRRISSAPTMGFARLADYRAARPDLVRDARDVEAVAALVGVPAERLAGHLAGGPSWKPPYVLVGPARPVVTVTEGSLAVDDHLRVLSGDGTPIPGLFAAGAAGQGGLLLLGHGLHLTWALTSGRAAAHAIAARAAGEGGTA
ncbi:FAD-dependent oxidoreductase [Rhizomonospora bruguierae]|uniref:FAD-dependent oxidoreductase n=1 Tax=Rhizomonospora bruguierae TaxID=1581705 RepID=UPI001BCD9DA1|nr:FAD-dependent oxidoreductase [Micromonospora sp. NBRC 107566]